MYLKCRILQSEEVTESPALPSNLQLLKESCWPKGAKPIDEKPRATVLFLFALAVLMMSTSIGRTTHEMTDGLTTAFPAAITVAASFDREICELWGRTMG